MKIATIVGNILSGLFIVFVGHLTFQYFSTNSIMTESYKITLAFSSAANLAAFAWYAGTTKQEEKFLVLLSTSILILAGALGKASCPIRGITGESLKDFQYYFNFNENWSFILKFLWHAALDYIVLLVVFLLKHLPIWYVDYCKFELGEN
jgi:hypothetical protein